MMPLIETIDGFLWGYLLVFLLLATGVFLTFVLRGIQVRQLGPALHLALIKRKEPTSEGDISHFQALMTALAATVGTGTCQEDPRLRRKGISDEGRHRRHERRIY